MAKYSYEIKLQVAHEYISGEGSYKYFTKSTRYLFECE